MFTKKAAVKDYNLNRHYDKPHKDAYDKYTGPARDALVTELKGRSIAHMNGFQRKLSLISFVRYPTSLPKLSGSAQRCPGARETFLKV